MPAVYPRPRQGLKLGQMAMNGPDVFGTEQKARVGDLLVDLGQSRVSRHGQPVALPRLSFDLFVALVRAAPRVLTFDELLQSVWPGLVVGPETISQRVKLLRAALGDDPKTPRYIAGVRGRGYQCIARVETWHELPRLQEPVPGKLSPVPDAPIRRAPWRTALILGACVVLAIGLAASAVQVLQRRPAAAAGRGPVPVVVLPFAALDGTEQGRVLAFGIAEAVLHQLARVPDLSIIAPTSSLTIDVTEADAQRRVEALQADYVLSGSVQGEGDRLRITARLVESRSGRNLWSLRFDRPPRDVFEVQDQIAVEVTRALSVSLDPAARERMLGQGTTNIEAYLEFLGGQESLLSWRSRQAGEASVHFQRALERDPRFVRAQVMLARSVLQDAQLAAQPDRNAAVEAARARAGSLVERALTVEPEMSDALVVRADLASDTDPGSAERDYRRALAQSPSDARAWQGLATLLWQDPDRRLEAEAMLDRARTLDPADPAHDVTRALYRLYGYGDAQGASELLQGVLARDPAYVPALLRLAEVRLQFQNRTAEAAALSRRALELDPESDWARRWLVMSEVLMGDLGSARALAAEGGGSVVGQLVVALAEGRDREAAELAYQAMETGALSGSDIWGVARVLQRDARRTGEYEQAAQAVEALTGVQWQDDGRPDVDHINGLLGEVLVYAQLLEEAGQHDRARQVIAAVESRVERQARETTPDNRWLVDARVRLATMRKDRNGALAALRQFCDYTLRCWFDLRFDPYLMPLRGDAAFRQIVESVEQRRRLERSRSTQLASAG